MTKTTYAAAFINIWSICTAFAQDSPTASPSPTPEPTRSPSAARNVRLSFVPPPAEGTISLGIFDAEGKLVRILHREAKIENFTVDADSLKTTWNGKNDAGEDLPAGKYRARGYLAEDHLNVNDLGKATEPPGDASDHLMINLEMNPLESDTRSVVDIAVGFDAHGSFLRTTDGLPLRTISGTPNVVRASITKNGERSADVWLDNGVAVEQFRVSDIDKMMAFDCGDFELK